MRRLILSVSLTLLMTVNLTCSLFAKNSIEGVRAKTFILAKVADNPQRVYPRLKPLADYLAAQLADQGIETGDVMIAPDNKAIVSWVKQGKVDMVTETPFSAVYIMNRSQAKAIARGWRRGVPSYHTVFFVHNDSAIQSLDDLVGKIIAFEDAGSTSAYFLPSAELLSKGFEMLYMGSLRESRDTGSINYVFSDEEINSTTWVHKKLVDAAALSNLDWDAEDSVPKNMLPDLRIIHRTRNFPRSVELVSPLRTPSFQNRLAEELHKAHTNPEGVAAMKKYKKTTRFDAINDTMKESLQSAKELLNVVRDSLE